VSLATIRSGLRDGLESTPRSTQTPYGDGHAAERIVQILLAGVPTRANRMDVGSLMEGVGPLS
jgi:UDP-N-acetylglucosamine 2-epimerase